MPEQRLTFMDGRRSSIAVNERAVSTGYSGSGSSPIANHMSSTDKLNYVRGFNVFFLNLVLK